ncbi:MAG: multidrug transporter [Lachnospiraceae bacterium]|nr:multidrug transporter [Lachnospiraceae bacterium]
MSEQLENRSVNEENYFTRQMFIRQYTPALISALALALGDMADALVIGNRMGAVGLAAIAFALPIYMVYNVIMHSFGLGGSIRFAKQMTRGDEQAAVGGFQGVMVTLLLIGAGIVILGNVLIHPLMAVLGVGLANEAVYNATCTYLRFLLCSAPLFFTAYGLGYFLRNDDLEKYASLSATIGNLSDLFLNIVLVLFCRMGVVGAGISTACGVGLTSAISIGVIIRKGSHLRVFPFCPSWKGLFSCFRTGLSSCVSYLYSMFFLLIGNNAMMRLAGEVGVAVFDVIQNITYFFTYLFGAISQASQPIFSTYAGEHNYEGCRGLLKIDALVGLVTGGGGAILVACFAPQMCRLFGLSGVAEVSLGTFALIVYCISAVFVGSNLLLGNYYLSRAQELPAFLISTLRGAAVLFPMTILFMNTDERIFWFLYPATEILSLFIFTVYRSVSRKKVQGVDEERIFRATLHNRVEEVGETTVRIEAFCEKWGAKFEQQYFVQMTVEETCTAIITGGFGGTGERGMIELTLIAEEDGSFTLHVRDSAASFNPFSLRREEVAGGDTEDLFFSAVGMDVIRQKAKDFFYRRYQGFNTMVVRI